MIALSGPPIPVAQLDAANVVVCWKTWPKSLPEGAPPAVLCVDRRQVSFVPRALRDRAAAIFVEPFAAVVFFHEVEDLLARSSIP